MQNGSFEAPIVNAPALWDIFVTALVPNWTIEWMPGSGGGYEPKLELHRGVNSWLSQDGLQHAELDTDWDGPSGQINGEAASVRIFQDVATQAGCTYNFSFWFSPRPGTPASDNILGAMWNGTDVEEITVDGSSNSNTVWVQHSYSVVATGATTRIQFEDRGTANSLGTFFDNVNVEFVSCPPPTPPCCGGDIKVKNRNRAVVTNTVTVIANTGGNTAAGGNGGTAIGGSANGGNNTGDIATGTAKAKSKVTNVVNTNVTRIRR